MFSIDAMKTIGASIYSSKRRATQRDFLNRSDSYGCSLACLRTAQLLVQSSGACYAVFWCFFLNQRIYQEKLLASGLRENCSKASWILFYLARRLPWRDFWWMDHRSWWTVLIWRWYEVRSKYLQNSFVYLSSRHVAGFWRLVLSC